jgi:hypothetical protein
LFTDGLETDRQCVSDHNASRVGNADATWRCDFLQAGCNVNSIAKDPLAIIYDVAQVNADTSVNLAVCRQSHIFCSQSFLYVDSGHDRIGDNWKYSQQIVTRPIHGSPTTVFDNGIYITKIVLQCPIGGVFIVVRQATELDYVKMEDGCKPARERISDHGDY